MKAQLAEADHRIVNISSELLELKEFHSNLPVSTSALQPL